MDKKKKLRSLYTAIPFGLGIIACLIVNFALDQRFTWSVLVTCSCLAVYIILLAIIWGTNHRILFAYVWVCILTIPLLYVIQWMGNLYLSEPIYWVTSFGIPITICWLAAIGIVVLIRKVTHANGWIMSGISVLAIYAGEKFTNYRVDALVGNSDSWRLSDELPVIYFGAAAVLLFVGVVFAVAKSIKKSA